MGLLTTGQYYGRAGGPNVEQQKANTYTEVFTSSVQSSGTILAAPGDNVHYIVWGVEARSAGKYKELVFSGQVEVSAVLGTPGNTIANFVCLNVVSGVGEDSTFFPQPFLVPENTGIQFRDAIHSNNDKAKGFGAKQSWANAGHTDTTALNHLTVYYSTVVLQP